jgi:hypothetical protein
MFDSHEYHIIRALRQLGGRAFTKDISERIRLMYPDDDGYQFRWAQQSLKKKKVLSYIRKGNKYLWILNDS